MPEKRRRINGLVGNIGTEQQFNSGVLNSTTVHTANCQGNEVTYSGGNHWPPSNRAKKADPNADRGRSFSNFKRTIITEAPSVAAVYRYGIPGQLSGWEYRGLLLAHSQAANLSGVPTPPSTFEVNNYGAKGWNQYKPTKPEGGLSQALGELRELPTLPRLLNLKREAKDFVRLQKDVGSDYLNVVFGWLPFVNDLGGFVKNHRNADRKLRQLMRDNGNWIRRRGIVHQSTQSSFSESNGYFTLPSLPSYLYDGVQWRTVNSKVEETWRFSGKFKYWIPTGSLPEATEQRKRQLARLVYGAELTPKLLYQLTPWSWLADWCANFGAIVSNLSDYDDRLVAQYAYIMCHKLAETQYTVRGKMRNHGTFTTTQTYRDEVKVRYRASPFGFGFAIPDLSPGQLAILGALGLSRF